MDRSTVPPPVTQVMDAASSWLPRAMADVEERLKALIGEQAEPLAGDGAATLGAGGKRLRPMLVWLCAGPDAGAQAGRAACAIELVHMATLIHDDVLDDAPLRRGLPTVLATGGPARACALGDLLFSRAFAELSVDGGERQVTLLARASVGLALGELAQRRDEFDLEVSAERYLQRCRLKTASLFECACVIGRTGVDATLASYGCELGLAFQLLDDVLDVAGPPERTGKARGTDLLDGTVTLPLILARERDRELGSLELRSLSAADAVEVCERIAATGALDVVRSDARARVEKAKRTLEAADLPAAQRELLLLVADGVVERYS